MSLLLAIIGHLVGDYLLQNDWMALNKKKRSWPCVVHCFLWANAVNILSGWTTFVFPKAFLIWLVLFTTHFIQDRTGIIVWWMDSIGQKQFRTGPCAPWSIIVVDNVWHILTIVAIWRLACPLT